MSPGHFDVQGIQPLLPQGTVPAQPFIDLDAAIPRAGDRQQSCQFAYGGRAASQRY